MSNESPFLYTLTDPMSIFSDDDSGVIRYDGSMAKRPMQREFYFEAANRAAIALPRETPTDPNDHHRAFYRNRGLNHPDPALDRVQRLQNRGLGGAELRAEFLRLEKRNQLLVTCSSNAPAVEPSTDLSDAE